MKLFRHAQVSNHFANAIPQPWRILLQHVEKDRNEAAFSKEFVKAPGQQVELLLVKPNDFIHQFLNRFVFLGIGSQRFAGLQLFFWHGAGV